MNRNRKKYNIDIKKLLKKLKNEIPRVILFDKLFRQWLFCNNFTNLSFKILSRKFTLGDFAKKKKNNIVKYGRDK